MSDDDAATEKKTEAEETAATDKAVEQDASAKGEPATESDATGSDAKESSPADSAATDETTKSEAAAPASDTGETVKLPVASAGDAKSADETVTLAASDETANKSASDDETVKAAAAADATVKLPTAAAEPAKPSVPQAVSESKGVGVVPLVAAFGAGVVVVAAVAAAVVFGIQAHNRGNELDARNSAVAAACDFGHQVGTYDSKTFGDYIKRVKDRSTGDWLTQFDGASAALEQITQQAQARSTVGEIHCAYESGDSNKASVVMLITQNQSKAATPTPQPLTIGVVASLQKKDGKWLVDNFQSPMTNDLQGATQQAPGADTQQPAPNAGTQPGN